MPIVSGARLEYYEILSPLGAGGMGEVWRARDTRLNREVAIKVLPASLTQDADRLRRFEQEARATSALNHPNIITIHEIGEVENTHYIVTEYVEGEMLRQRMMDAPQQQMTASEALDIAVQIAAALAAAHRRGITHRDIKPENVMVRRDGIVKVLDFGLAKLTEPAPPFIDSQAPTLARNSTEAGIVMGTPRYMSPEQVRGEKVDVRTDIFSLGVMLYEMVAGRAPFAGATTSEVIAAILRDSPPPLSRHAPETPPELERIVSHALQKNRAERYQTARDLLSDLKGLQEELMIVDRGARSAALKKSDALAEESDSKPKASFFSILIRPAWIVAAALLVGILGFALAYFRRAPELPPLKIVPFTSFPGNETNPSFSPDGNQIAFAWNGEKGDNFDIYVKQIGVGVPLRLTNSPADEMRPVWSPDGRYIAFVRFSKTDSGVFTVPALGGSERQLYTTPLSDLDGFQTYLSWSPDGKYIAFSGRENMQSPFSIFRLAVEGLERQQLTSPLPEDGGHYMPAFSPDGQTLAFVYRTNKSSGIGDIYLLPVSGGNPRRLTYDNKIISGLAWSADGKEIIFSSDRVGNRSLWKITVASGNNERIASGDYSVDPAVSRQGQRLAYSHIIADTDIWRIEISNLTQRRGSAVKLISSTLLDDSPQYSPDGSKIVFASTRTSHEEIWMCSSDGSSPVQLTSFNGPPTGTPRWSPDGKQIAFDSVVEGARDIYVVRISDGKQHRLTTEPSDETRASWSRDGKWIYFGSNCTGSWQVWKTSVNGGPAVQVTKQGGREAFESPDGKFVYYTKGTGLSSIWRIPVGSGEETQVLDQVYQGYWGVLDQGIYFINLQDFTSLKATPARFIEFFDFATGRKTQIAKVEKPMPPSKPSLAVSPDGRWILWVQADRRESDIMLIENFR